MSIVKVEVYIYMNTPFLFVYSNIFRSTFQWQGDDSAILSWSYIIRHTNTIVLAPLTLEYIYNLYCLDIANLEEAKSTSIE